MNVTEAKRLPSLDGWRAVSILLVLGAHSKFAPEFPSSWDATFRLMFNGNLGVRAFFVISGFLITWLLLKEQANCGHVSLRRFYIRRALRILPVYVAFLSVVWIIQLTTPFRQSPETWLANLTFTTGVAWWNNASSVMTDHLWSLAVEEQFYLLWPFILVFLSLARRPAAAIAVLSIPILIAPIVRVIAYLKLEPTWAAPLCSQYSFATNFDSIAVGCLGAFFMFYKEADAQKLLCRWRPWAALSGFLLLVVPEVLGHLFLAGAFTVPFGRTVQAVGLVLLICQSVLQPEKGFYRLLNLKPVMWVGVLSYSLYIWQQIFWMRPQLFGLQHAWWLSWPGWLLGALAAACSSYYLLERPFMNLRARLRFSTHVERAPLPT